MMTDLTLAGPGAQPPSLERRASALPPARLSSSAEVMLESEEAEEADMALALGLASSGSRGWAADTGLAWDYCYNSG